MGGFLKRTIAENAVPVRLHTLGVFSSTYDGGWLNEPQLGDFEGQDHSAFALAYQAGYTFQHDWKPRLVQIQLVPGDDDPMMMTRENFDNWSTNHQLWSDIGYPAEHAYIELEPAFPETKTEQSTMPLSSMNPIRITGTMPPAASSVVEPRERTGIWAAKLISQSRMQLLNGCRLRQDTLISLPVPLWMIPAGMMTLILAI